MNRFIICISLGLCFSINAWATTIVETGSCGTNCTYSIDSDGKLIVSGVSRKEDAGVIRWYQFRGREDITSIEITGNFLSAGSNAFGNMPNVTNIKIGDGLQTIETYTFSGTGATSIEIGNVGSIRDGAFMNMSNLETVTFADGANPRFGPYVFSGSGGENGLVIALPEGMTNLLTGYSLGGVEKLSVVMPDSTNSDSIAWVTSGNINLYCNDTPEHNCVKGFRVNLLQGYAKEDGMYILEEGENKTYFSSAVNMASGHACQNTDTQEGLDSCIAQALQNKGKCQSAKECKKIVENAHRGEFMANGKSYISLNDFINGKYIPKRIYTVEEAAAVVKPQGNTFRIRYR